MRPIPGTSLLNGSRKSCAPVFSPEFKLEGKPIRSGWTDGLSLLPPFYATISVKTCERINQRYWFERWREKGFSRKLILKCLAIVG